MRFVCLFVVLISCGPGALTEKELIAYVENPENGVSKAIVNDQTKVEMYYKPIDLVIKQELGDATDKESVRIVSERLDSLDYFVLKFSNRDHEIENMFAGDRTDLAKALNYLSFGISDDIKMVCESDTIPAAGVIYSRSYNTTTATSLLVVFPSFLRKRKEVQVQCLFDDNMFGTGLNRFKFDTRSIKNIPKLNNN